MSNTVLILLLLGVLAMKKPPATGLASWYGEEHRGKIMANGKPFDPDAMTCASWYYPFGTRLRVTYRDKSVIVTVTDRGPNKRLKGRAIDLSKASFLKLADTGMGVILVAIEEI